eukprot:1195871-Prorocentrum_minimum.AAC.13
MSPGVDCRPAMCQSAGNVRRIFGRMFEMSCAEWYTSVDSRLSTVELKSKAFLAVDSGACITRRCFTARWYTSIRTNSIHEGRVAESRVFILTSTPVWCCHGCRRELAKSLALLCVQGRILVGHTLKSDFTVRLPLPPPAPNLQMCYISKVQVRRRPAEPEDSRRLFVPTPKGFYIFRLFSPPPVRLDSDSLSAKRVKRVTDLFRSYRQVLELEHPKKDTRDLALYAPFCRNGKAPSPNLGKKMEEWNGRGRPKGLKVLAAEVRLGLDKAVKPLLSPSTTGEFNSPKIFAGAEKAPKMKIVR